MKNIEAIQLALEKAHRQGYQIKEAFTKDYFQIKVTQFDEATKQISVEVKGKSGKEKLLLDLRQLLFELPFARALFGDFWEIHLNLMACSTDQLEYLRGYLLEHQK